MKNRIICCAMCLVMLVGCLCGCSEAEKVNKNISKQANYFETERVWSRGEICGSLFFYSRIRIKGGDAPCKR